MAVDYGFVPTEDSIFLEPVNDDSDPYVNVIVARAEDADNEVYQKNRRSFPSRRHELK